MDGKAIPVVGGNPEARLNAWSDHIICGIVVLPHVLFLLACPMYE